MRIRNLPIFTTSRNNFTRSTPLLQVSLRNLSSPSCNFSQRTSSARARKYSKYSKYSEAQNCEVCVRSSPHSCPRKSRRRCIKPPPRLCCWWWYRTLVAEPVGRRANFSHEMCVFRNRSRPACSSRLENFHGTWVTLTFYAL